ncbi:molybdenum cofactor biosynthesis protein B [Halobacteriales archaeon QS_4_69_34]|nr:MAG: molybdenum cofactor biosynthesis protein B [Halobacteriales archaeon QS_4_69_34]
MSDDGNRDRDHEHGRDEHHDDNGDEHQPVHGHGHDFGPVGAAVLTISTSRSLEDDPAGDVIAAAFEASGDEIVTRELVGDDYDGVQGAVDALVDRDDVDVVVTTGGTGVTPDDVTVEAVEPLLEKELPGFGELFRELSRTEIGTRVVATRATAGVVDGVPVFCLPGSEDAARLGTEQIVVEEAGHLVGLAGRDTDGGDGDDRIGSAGEANGS